MKKYVIFLMIVVLTVLVCSCSHSSGRSYVEKEDIETLSAEVGFDISVPVTARNISCFIENSYIAEVNFSFNGIAYKYRVSKIKADDELYGGDFPLENKITVPFGERADIDMYSSSGKRIAVWHKDGTNYALLTETEISDDMLTEVCDLLV